MRGIKTLTTQLSSNEIGFPRSIRPDRSITRESVDDLQISFGSSATVNVRNRDGQMTTIFA